MGLGAQNERSHCKARRPDLTLEDERRKEINVVDMACPGERNKIVNNIHEKKYSILVG